MSLIQYVRAKCVKCGNKFTLRNDCKTCTKNDIVCKHRTLCGYCFKDTIGDKVFFGALTAIVLVSYYAIGVKIF